MHIDCDGYHWICKFWLAWLFAIKQIWFSNCKPSKGSSYLTYIFINNMRPKLQGKCHCVLQNIQLLCYILWFYFETGKKETKPCLFFVYLINFCESIRKNKWYFIRDSFSAHQSIQVCPKRLYFLILLVFMFYLFASYIILLVILGQKHFIMHFLTFKLIFRRIECAWIKSAYYLITKRSATQRIYTDQSKTCENPIFCCH